MNNYKRHRLPPDIISYAVWFHYRFNLSCHDVEDLLAERGIIVSYETIRLWRIIGARYAGRLKQRHRGYGDTFYTAAAKRFFRRLMRNHGGEPRKIVTDKLRSYGVAEQLLSTHAAVYNLFNLGRHLVKAEHYRNLRISAFKEWKEASA